VGRSYCIDGYREEHRDQDSLIKALGSLAKEDRFPEKLQKGPSKTLFDKAVNTHSEGHEIRWGRVMATDTGWKSVPPGVMSDLA
jgi:hypothetical protein